jgi:hypothetical protein
MPVETAKSVRNRQNKRITGYNPEDFARQFRRIMKKSDIEDYTILIPRQQAEVQYGIWIVFTR